MFLVDARRGAHRRRQRSCATSSRPPRRTASGSRPNLVSFDDLPGAPDAHSAPRDAPHPAAPARLHAKRSFSAVLAPAASGAATRRWARWAPTRPSRCSRRQPRRLSEYFTQLFAQVTNPPLDAIREQLGDLDVRHDRAGGQPARPRPAQLPARRPRHARCSRRTSSASSATSTSTARRPGFRAFAIDGLFDVADRPSPRARGASEWPSAVAACCAAGRGGDGPPVPTSSSCPTETPTPTPHRCRRCCSPRRCTTTSCGAAVGSRPASSSSAPTRGRVHDLALLVGYGASAVNPYLALDTVEDLARAA